MRTQYSLPFGISSLLALILSGCQTPMVTQFKKLKPGMEKGEVLEIMGSPNQSRRWHGLDQWTYVSYENDDQNRNEVHFSEGKVTYLGPPIQPEVSAEQQDLIHEVSNQEVEERFRRRREEADHNLENYENEMRGTENDPGDIPEFKPIR